jgi:large subunit ribosomal protein L15
LAETKKVEKIDIQTLIDAGFVSSNHLVKILGNGALTTKVDVEAHAFSKSAEAAIQAIGGTATKLK